MGKGAKLAIISVLVVFSSSVLGSHSMGTLYPASAIALIIGVLAVLALQIWTDLRPSVAVFILAVIGAAHRVWYFLFPASMMRFDPDAYAVRSQIIISSGSFDPIVNDFYHIAAAFPVAGAISGIITQLDINVAYIVFPLATGLSLPLLSAVLARRVSSAQYSGTLAASIVTVGGASTLFSIAPIPITLASIYLTGAIVAALLVPAQMRSESMALLGVFCVAAALSHKIPLLLLVGIAGVFVIYTIGLPGPDSEVRWGFGPTFAIFSGLMLVVQWVYLSDYFADAVIEVLILTGLRASSIGRAIPKAAVRLDPPLFSALLNNSYYLLLLLVGGISWVLLLREYQRRNVRILQSAAGITVLLTIPSAVIGAGPGFQRVYIYGTAFVAALIAVTLSKTETTDSRKWKALASIVIIAIVVVNPLAVIATPDHPGTTRQYLTAAEVQAKHFSNSHTDDVVYRDLMYGDEVVDFEAAAKGDEWHQRQVPSPWYPGLLSEELYDGTLIEQNYEKISLRTNVDIWRLRGGRYRLTWDPESSLDETYNRVYANGEVVNYDR